MPRPRTGTLTIVEPYFKSLETGRRMATLGRHLGLERVALVANKVRLVHSAWERSGIGPQRRIYEITRAGMEELHALARALESGRHGLEVFLSRYAEFASIEPAAPRHVH